MTDQDVKTYPADQVVTLWQGEPIFSMGEDKLREAVSWLTRENQRLHDSLEIVARCANRNAKKAKRWRARFYAACAGGVLGSAIVGFVLGGMM